MKIRPVGAELFHADGRTFMTKLTVAFRNFLNKPKKTTNDFSFRKFERPLVEGNTQPDYRMLLDTPVLLRQ
jgi:hypothetical protein